MRSSTGRAPSSISRTRRTSGSRPTGRPTSRRSRSGVPILAGLKVGATQRKGFPVVPVGYFKLTAKPAPRDPELVVEGGARAPLLLLDVDPASPARGTAVPVVAHTPNADPYVPENLIAIAARPGIILTPNRKYAFVVTRGLGLESGATPEAPAVLAALARGETPSGERGAAMGAISTPRCGRRSTRWASRVRTSSVQPCSRRATSSRTRTRSERRCSRSTSRTSRAMRSRPRPAATTRRSVTCERRSRFRSSSAESLRSTPRASSISVPTAPR